MAKPPGSILEKGWQPLPAGLGARIGKYRCCLPALAEFSTYRREGPTRTTIESGVGGERGIRTLGTGLSRTHTFQACSLNHSDTSPQYAATQGCNPSQTPESNWKFYRDGRGRASWPVLALGRDGSGRHNGSLTREH